ncbi:hypothetical protein ERO13_A01G230250v2 [Gossypium hirsutum]|nr:hypothetical protein ERO13_A01G230250v2 [Gossypium hirsutum]
MMLDPIPTREPYSGVSAINRRWKREDLLNKGSLFSEIGFLLSLHLHYHGFQQACGWKNFDRYSEYRYFFGNCSSIDLYTGGQAWRQVLSIWKNNNILEQRISAMPDFFGDQMVAYLLISSTSAAIPLTNNMREGQDNISPMPQLRLSVCHFCLPIAGTISHGSGYKLSTQSYI